MTQSGFRKFISQATKDRPIGVVLAPLRVFLGVTFIYAGLLKLSSSDYLNQTAPNGVLKQMQNAAVGSPISFIVQHAVEHYQLAGLAIAFGELFVGIGILFGIWTRIAATFSFILSASFWLTVSWSTSPYFFGPDIVFMAAVTPLIIAGDGGFLSVGSRIRAGVARQMKTAGVALNNAPLQQEIDRRTVVRTGAVAGVLAGVGLLAGGIGRFFSKATPAPVAAPTHSSSAKPTSGAPSGGVKIASASAVAVGSSFQFTDRQGSPAYLLQPSSGKYLAYSAVCTHQGCIVGFDKGSTTFQCPCHGASYDGKTGQVIGGPAPSPLAKIQVVESGGDIYMV
jgi:thiosulfate dehydrogenase (quinone) large subunit